MERRTFVKGAFGLTVLVAGASLGIVGLGSGQDAGDRSHDAVFTTPELAVAADAPGPAMQSGIALVPGEDPGSMAGYFATTQLFNVDKSGAALMMLADGTRTIEDIAAQASLTLGQPVDPAAAAEFFVALGQSGYLQNEVLVNLYEIAG